MTRHRRGRHGLTAALGAAALLIIIPGANAGSTITTPPGAKQEMADLAALTPVPQPYMTFSAGIGSTFSSVSTGYVHSCGITAAGGVACWGKNGSGQLGNGTTADSTVPVTVTGLKGRVTGLALGSLHTCAVLRSGAVQCWGNNLRGRLGDGTQQNRVTPVTTAGLQNVREITAGANHTCARTHGGTVKCWGSNTSGQLGDGTTQDHLVPTAVPGASPARSISAGDLHTCAVQADRPGAPGARAGQVTCWGDGDSGKLGAGDEADRATPTIVPGLADVVEISAGTQHSCALTTEGAAWCWGRNSSGQIGDGTVSAGRLTPIRVVDLADVVMVDAGGAHTCALLQSSAVKCWGYNEAGQVGDRTMDTPRLRPTQVNGLASGVTWVSAGALSSCGVLSTGAAACWGSNRYGQLGDASRTDSAVPSTVV